MFGGYLPVERTTESSSLKHRGNTVHKERKLRILRVVFTTGIDRYLTANRERGQVCLQSILAPLIREE